MSWLNALDPYRPWLWPRVYRALTWGVLFVVGWVGLSWVDFDDVLFPSERTLQTQHEAALQTLGDLQQQITDKTQRLQHLSSTPTQLGNLPSWMPRLTSVAHAAGVSVTSMQVLQRNDLTSRLNWQVTGKTQSVWSWLHHTLQQHSALVLQHLELHAAEDTSVAANGVWDWSPLGSIEANKVRGHMFESAAGSGGFDSVAWSTVQHQHAAQHPSYRQWVMPELQRPRQTLEKFPLTALRYEGVISKPFTRQGTQALVHIMDTSAAMMPVVRVNVGEYIGPSFGKLQTIAPDHLLLRELWRDENGIWAPRWLRLPLGDGHATIVSSREGH